MAAAVAVLNNGDNPVVIRPNSLVAIDAASNEPQASVSLSTGAGPVAVGEGAVWVGNARDRTLVRIDPLRNEVTKEIGLPLGPDAIAVGEGGIWVAEADFSMREVSFATLTRIDPATNAVRLAIPFGARQPGSATVGASAVWVTDTAEDRVWKIDATKNSVVGTIGVGDGPTIVAATRQAV